MLVGDLKLQKQSQKHFCNCFSAKATLETDTEELIMW